MMFVKERSPNINLDTQFITDCHKKDTITNSNVILEDVVPEKYDTLINAGLLHNEISLSNHTFNIRY